MTTPHETFDLVGIGFGPSNISLAIALAEAGLPLRARFLEAQSGFAWHPGMMIPGADMQISFLKDLVSQRNPQSPYTFINYLHCKKRLNAFINRKTFFPSRTEFNDYLAWVAASFDNCDYDRRVTGIEPVERHGKITELTITAQDSAGAQYRYGASNLVIAPGGQPHFPQICNGLKDDPRISHSNDYMTRLVPDLRTGERIAIIGAGQSAAEIFADLATRPQMPHVTMVLRGHAMRPSDDSPFVNEIFAPDQTDAFHALSDEQRRAALGALAGTNYAVVDQDLISTIYTMLYEQDVTEEQRLALWPRTSLTGIRQTDNGIELVLEGPQGMLTGCFDRIVFATGYCRSLDERILHDIAPYCRQPRSGRNYRLEMTEGFAPAIFVQGYSEETHGLSDTLLSVLAQRSHEIAQSLSRLPLERQEIAAE